MLAHLLGGGQTSFLYRTLVIEEKLAVSAWAYYHGAALDQSRFIVNMTPAPGVSLETLDKAFDRALAKFVEDGIDAGDLERAKTRLVADAIYARDSQSDLARWYGSSLAIGQTLRDVEEWPARIERGQRRGRDRGGAPLARSQARGDRISHAARRRGGLRRPQSPAPHGAKKTNTLMETPMQKHLAVSPSHSAVNVDVVDESARPQILARAVPCGAAGFARIRDARRRGAGPGSQGGPGRADGGPSRRGRGRTRFAGVSSRSRRESGRNVVPLRPRSLERADAHAHKEPRSRRRIAAACGQRAPVRRGAVRARARAHERAPAPRRQRSGDARQPQLEGEVLPPSPLWPAGRRHARNAGPHRAGRSRRRRQARDCARPAVDRGRRRDR